MQRKKELYSYYCNSLGTVFCCAYPVDIVSRFNIFFMVSTDLRVYIRYSVWTNICEIQKYNLSYDYARIKQVLYGWNGIYIYGCDALRNKSFSKNNGIPLNCDEGCLYNQKVRINEPPRTFSGSASISLISCSTSSLESRKISTRRGSKSVPLPFLMISKHFSTGIASR